MSTPLLSWATGVMAGLLSTHHAETDRLPRAPVGAASERCAGNTSFTCVLTSSEGQQSSVRGRTRISFVIGLAAPLRHDLVSLAPLSSMRQLGPIFIRFHVGSDIALRNADDVIRWWAGEVRALQRRGELTNVVASEPTEV